MRTYSSRQYSTDTTYVYLLRDPRTLEVKYVGKTVKPLAWRLSQHLADARRKGGTHTRNWLRSLLVEDLRPAIELLEAVSTDSDWAAVERTWISYYLNLGCVLTNHTSGGEGLPGHRHTDETRAKISAAQKGKPRLPWTDEAKQKVSVSLMGRKFSEEHRRKIGEANRKRQYSAETRKKLSEAQKRVWASLPEREKQRIVKAMRSVQKGGGESA